MRHIFLVALMFTGCGGVTTGTEAPLDANASDAMADGAGEDTAPDGKSDGSAKCAGDMMACTRREDCCNTRHSCIGGACMYSAPAKEAPPEM